MTAQSLDTDFGSYLASLQERDIDLLLLEELHVDPAFSAWFADAAGVENATFDGAWHSVTDADGETDLLLRVSSDTSLVGILIENKVSAPQQEKQDERYHLRAARAQNAGYFDTFVTCMCAPETYLRLLPTSSLYDVRISYEAIAAWFDAGLDARSRWRAGMMRAAIAHGRRGYRMIVNETVSAFHVAFWDHLRQHHPRLLMRRPTAKGNKSNWILFGLLGAPRGVGFHLKMDQCVVELGFNGRLIEELQETQSSWPDGVVLVQKGKTAALAHAVPFLDRTRPIEEQTAALEAIFEAVWKLAPYATILMARGSAT